MDENVGLNLLPAKRKKLTNYEQCIICQSINKGVCLRKAQVPSIEKLIYAAQFAKMNVLSVYMLILEILHLEMFCGIIHVMHPTLVNVICIAYPQFLVK